MKKLIIFGNKQLAEIAHFYLTRDSQFDIAGFTADGQYVTEDSFCGLPVVPFEELTKFFPPDSYSALVAVSYSKLNTIRTAKYKALKELGYEFISYVHSSTINYAKSIGENCLILDNVNIQPFVQIGNNVTIWCSNHIGHHAIIRDNCFITSHVVISGGVEIGESCFIGGNAMVGPQVKVGRSCIIGAAALVMQDAAENGVYPGVESARSRIPSHRIRSI